VEDERLGALVFHSGTARQGERLVTNGGRIVGLTGVADHLEDARAPRKEMSHVA
jgi:phosphoribosylamine--glycine ligase